MTDRQLKIISMPVDEGGCGHYRVRQPLSMIEQHTRHATHLVTAGDDMQHLAIALSQSDVVLLRQGAEEAVRQFRQINEFKHLKYVLDIDDNIELISPYSSHYKEYGTAYFKDIWTEDTPEFDPVHNRERVDSLIGGMREADMVTVTTPALAEYAGRYSKNVAILPNAVNIKHWWPMKVAHKGLRVGWSGGSSHYEDWYSIKEPLNKLLRKYQFTLVSVGAHFPGIVDPDLRHLVEVWPWVPFDAHSYRMMCMALDMAIIPLAELPFNRYKSAIKLYEMCALGIPSVVAEVTPYKEETDSGQFFYNTPAEFTSCLQALLESSETREAMATRGRNWVETHHDANKQADLWIEKLTSVL